MYTPTKKELKRIQGNIVDYNDVHMSVCGSGCSCPCKQSSTIDSLRVLSSGMCGCNCTCGCNCNSVAMDMHIEPRRIF